MKTIKKWENRMNESPQLTFKEAVIAEITDHRAALAAAPAQSDCSDANVHAFMAIQHNGHWCGPISIQRATPDDLREQEALDIRAAALERAKALGLSDADLKALGVK